VESRVIFGADPLQRGAKKSIKELVGVRLTKDLATQFLPCRKEYFLVLFFHTLNIEVAEMKLPAFVNVNFEAEGSGKFVNFRSRN